MQPFVSILAQSLSLNPSLYGAERRRGALVADIDGLFTPAQAGGRLPHRGEGGRDQQLVFLSDRTDARLWRPRAAAAAGFLADAGALGQLLVYPGGDVFFDPADTPP